MALAPPPPSPAAELMEELVGEILLRLPPEEPEHLFRAALVCKPWLRVLSSATPASAAGTASSTKRLPSSASSTGVRSSKVPHRPASPPPHRCPTSRTRAPTAAARAPSTAATAASSSTCCTRGVPATSSGTPSRATSTSFLRRASNG
ncbi:unnamed protein product [Urochloa humidicola]